MKKITRYIKSSIDELKRVIWPTRKQATILTVVVLGFTAVVALYLAFCLLSFSTVQSHSLDLNAQALLLRLRFPSPYWLLLL
jgi:preprotein translocase SecE subunit